MMNSTTTTTTTIIIKATSTAVVAFVLGISIYIPYAKYRWEYRLKSFIEENQNNNNKNNNKNNNNSGGGSCDSCNDDILLIVNPASGGGKSMELYPTIIEELQKHCRRNNNSNSNVHVFITQSSNDMINFTRRLQRRQRQTTNYYYHHISKYKIIAIMGGDSSITEFVQYELQQNNGKWLYAPILHLPTGTGNAISTECFGGNGSSNNIKDIIQHGLTKYKFASVLKITTTTTSSSSPSNSGQEEEEPPPKYALHNCFDGIQRYMIDNLDICRKHLYPAFGKLIVMPIVITSLLMFDYHSDRNNKIPYILAIITDTEGMDMKLNFGLSRFSSSTEEEEDKKKKTPEMMMIIRATYWPGPIQFLLLFQKFMSGELGNDFATGKKLPDWLYMEKTNRFTLLKEEEEEGAKNSSSPSSSSPASGDGDGDDNTNSFNMYLDGGGTIPCKGNLPITFEVIPNSIPYFVHDGM